MRCSDRLGVRIVSFLCGVLISHPGNTMTGMRNFFFYFNFLIFLFLLSEISLVIAFSVVSHLTYLR